MNNKIFNIIEELKSLTLVEASELVKEIEKTFDVDASIQASVAAAPVASIAQASAPAVEEKTTFDVILAEVPVDKKIAILKVVRTITGLGLKESKDIVDNIPKTVKEGVTKEEAENIKKELETAGAKVTIK